MRPAGVGHHRAQRLLDVLVALEGHEAGARGGDEEGLRQRAAGVGERRGALDVRDLMGAVYNGVLYNVAPCSGALYRMV